jgi:hypothetical protein
MVIIAPLCTQAKTGLKVFATEEATRDWLDKNDPPE